ncbi:MAG: TIGR02117 family protein [Pseudomonadota bacterium]
MGRMVWRLVRNLLLALVVLVVGYALAAVAGSAIPVNGAWQQAEAGVTVYVIDNGVHTDLVLPAQGWEDLVRPGDLADPAQAAQSHVAFGWGNRDFYLNTPTWSQVNPLRVVGALAGGGRTVLHVSHIPQPGAGPHIRAVILRPDEFNRLTAHIRATFAPGPSVHGYAANDAFYEAKGSYSAVNTCNQWTATGLRAAGVRMGAWTPFTFGVMRWL